MEKDNAVNKPAFMEKDNAMNKPAFMEKDNDVKKPTFIEKINKSDLFKKIKSVKHIEIIVAVILVAIMLLIYASTLTGSKNTFSDDTNNTVKLEVEERMEQILEKIDGAGRVSVMIYYENSEESVKTTSLFNNNNQKVETTNKIKGVIIVSEGADNIKVRLALLDAVRTLLEIEADKVKIYKMK